MFVWVNNLFLSLLRTLLKYLKFVGGKSRFFSKFFNSYVNVTNGYIKDARQGLGEQKKTRVLGGGVPCSTFLASFIYDVMFG